MFTLFLAHLVRQARLNVIEQVRWEVGMLPGEIKEKLSKDELSFYEAYNEAVADYMEEVGLDLSRVEGCF